MFLIDDDREAIRIISREHHSGLWFYIPKVLTPSFDHWLFPNLTFQYLDLPLNYWKLQRHEAQYIMGLNQDMLKITRWKTDDELLWTAKIKDKQETINFYRI